MNAQFRAGLDVLEELFDGMLGTVQRRELDALNWAPLSTDANSIAAMVTHVCGSIDSWLARALVETIERDRDAEFRVRATGAALAERIERCRAETRARFAALESLDPATERQVRRLSRNQEMTVSVAWCVEHAIAHAAEHWGQIQLTGQLVAAQA